MRAGLSSFIVCLVISSCLHAQDRCGTVAPTTGAFESWMSEKIAKRKAQITRETLGTVYQIPVVVHVIHKGEPIGTGTNLSEERILAQIDSLSADFRRMNADAINTPSAFLPVAADVEIEFVLAKQDPAGNPTNGIVRVQGSKNSYRSGTDRPLLRSESYWPPSHYFNIFVLDLQSFLGYASFPLISIEGITNGSDDYKFDGVLIDYEYFGVNPAASSFESYGRTLTHEVGHWLGLRHIWGDGDCSVDDFVSDTPPADTNNGGVTSPCTFPNPDDNIICVEPEMFQNYMDYTDDICMNLFTEGQKIRMRTVMENAPNRLTLTTSPALTDPVRFADDLAAIEIISPNIGECENTFSPTLRVANYGNNEITSFSVQFYLNGSPIGSPQNFATSLLPLTDQTISFSPIFVSSSATLTFEITEVNGGPDGNATNNTISRTMRQTTTQSLPFAEFNETGAGWIGSIGGNSPWEVVNAPKNTSTNNALIFKSHNDTQWFGDQTIIKTPIFDLTNITSGEIQFSYAHAPKPDAFFDGLMVKASTDCGKTFPDVLFQAFGTDLATAPPTNDPFIPSSQLEWMDTLISITEYRGIDGVQFAFFGLSGGGNHLYLDDVLITETNLFENDIKPLALSGPLITCSELSDITLQIRNNGSEDITSFEIKYFVNGDSSTAQFFNQNIKSKEIRSVTFPAANLIIGENTIRAEIISVNMVPDESSDENMVSTVVFRDNKKDEYPLLVDFENPDQWQTAARSTDTLWRRVQLPDGNHVLKAEGYDATSLGEKSWFISPELNIDDLDSAGLFFKASYASNANFDDKLEVLLSVDCGKTYNPTPLLEANADSLAVNTSTERWVPDSDEDWKEYRIDLSETFLYKDEIRIAFVFTSGGGNDLYLDDISIRSNEPPTYQDFFRVYPNPANSQFNIGLNLTQKEPLMIKLIDISGKIIFEERIENGLNQILRYEAPSQQGLYFLYVSGRSFTSSQKLFINR